MFAILSQRYYFGVSFYASVIIFDKFLCCTAKCVSSEIILHLKFRKYRMDLTMMSTKERIEMMRKRQAYFSAVAEKYTSFTDFIRAQEMWLAIMGIELTEYEDYLQLYIQLDFTEYEYYFIIKTPDGTLTVSDIILWQDEVCCNSYFNISTGERAIEEDIFKSE
ncbi:MAG: hypothetical protein K2G52_03725 [Muribaculaceae bacterium]|nr:hypothetical protein [Muribaculaceae bacterium]